MYSLEIINLAISKFFDGDKITSISRSLKITYNTINKWFILFKDNIDKKSFITTNDYNQKFKKNRNSKSLKHEFDIKEYVKNNEGCSLKDIAIHINKELSMASLSKLLKKLNITRKKN